MKKYGKSLIAAVFFCTAVLGSIYLKSGFPGPVSQDGETHTKVENPVPPDLQDLESLGMEPFQSCLPVIMMDTQNQQLMKEDTRWVRIAVLDDPSGENDILGKADRVLDATAKYRGASSYSGFDKMQYRIDFYQKPGGSPMNYALCGMKKDSKWVLNGPFLDRSLIRNAFMYQLSRKVMDHAPDCRFCELFVDGKYQGVYLAVEPITDGKNRLALNQFSLASGKTPYIVKRDRAGTETNVLDTYGGQISMTSNELSISYPSESHITRKQILWIEKDISQFEKALYGEQFADPETGYAAYIDVDSFVDYFILNEFSMNNDAGMLSTYAYKDMDQKLRLCVWDFNNAFDNYPWFTMDSNQFYMTTSNWFSRLLQDRNFVNRIVARYQKLRQDLLSDEHIAELLAENQEVIGTDAIERNFTRWGYTLQQHLLTPDPDQGPRDPASYEQAVQMLKTCIEERLKFMDSSIETLYDLCIN